MRADNSKGWIGFCLTMALLAGILFCVMTFGGCQQMWEQPYPHEAKVHWMDNFWLSEKDAKAKQKYNNANPPTDFFDRMTR